MALVIYFTIYALVPSLLASSKAFAPTGVLSAKNQTAQKTGIQLCNNRHKCLSIISNNSARPHGVTTIVLLNKRALLNENNASNLYDMMDIALQHKSVNQHVAHDGIAWHDAQINRSQQFQLLFSGLSPPCLV